MNKIACIRRISIKASVIFEYERDGTNAWRYSIKNSIAHDCEKYHVVCLSMLERFSLKLYSRLGGGNYLFDNVNVMARIGGCFEWGGHELYGIIWY